MIYLQNIEFLSSIFWPEGAYTDATYANDARIIIPYGDEILNHNYIGSLGCIPNDPKSRGTVVRKAELDPRQRHSKQSTAFSEHPQILTLH